jgi:hypothetical protein
LTSCCDAAFSTLAFTAPEAGRATLAWYGPRHVLLARAVFAFSKAAIEKRPVELTRPAKALRSSSGELRIEAVATFTPSGSSTVKVSRSFTTRASLR